MLTFNNNDYASLEDHQYTLRDITDALGYDWGMQDYPIFDEAYREKLNRAIWNHFAFRRIAADTPAMFIFYLNRRMNEQMPNFNAIYELVRREQFDPFATTQGKSHMDTSGTGTSDTSASSNGTDANETRATASSTPQVFLDNPDGEQYLTGVNKQTGTSNQTGESAQHSDNSQAGTSDNTYSAINGSIGTAVYDMMGSGFMATDTLVFNALEPLFMQVWDDMPM